MRLTQETDWVERLGDCLVEALSQEGVSYREGVEALAKISAWVMHNSPNRELALTVFTQIVRGHFNSFDLLFATPAGEA